MFLVFYGVIEYRLSGMSGWAVSYIGYVGCGVEKVLY